MLNCWGKLSRLEKGGALFSKLGISLMFEYFIRCVGYKLRCRNEIITQSLTSRTGQVAVDGLNLWEALRLRDRPLFCLQLSPSPGLVKILPREPSAEQPGSPHPSQSFLVDAEGNWLSRSWGLVFLDGARWGSNLQGPCLPAKRRNCPWPEALSISADLRSCLLTLALRQSLTGSLLLCVILCFFLHQVFV